jgi:hypothetical protein
MGVEESIEAARQMQAKSGPYYQRWLERSREELCRRLNAIEEELGIPPDQRSVLPRRDQFAQNAS